MGKEFTKAMQVTSPSKPKPYNITIPRQVAKVSNSTASVGNASKIESPIYTGNKMIGIGQLHKSNAVPIFQTEDAKDLANMRR